MSTQVPVQLSSGATLLIEDVASLPVGTNADGTLRPEAFGFGGEFQKFDHVKETIEGIATELKASFDRVTPHSASVEFGLEISAEPGFLTAALVKGSGTAHLTITLGWEREAGP